MIDLARDALACDSPFWAYYLAYGLEQAHSGGSLEWGMRCVSHLLPASGSPSLPQLKSDLSHLAAWVHGLPLQVLYRPELAREIWYRPGYDPAKIAVSHLYGAYERYRRHDRGLPHVVGAAVASLLLEGSAWSQQRDGLFAIIVANYQQLLAEYTP